MLARPALNDFAPAKSPLEWQFILSYLSEKGYSFEDLKTMPDGQSNDLMSEACWFASKKLIEIEARIQYLQSFNFEEW